MVENSITIRDYSGGGSRDIAVFRGTTGLWAIRGITRKYFGSSSDYPVPADYTGTDLNEIGVFRPATGLWAISGLTRVYYGSSCDLPLN
jgi:hypothetical protein